MILPTQRYQAKDDRRRAIAAAAALFRGLSYLSTRKQNVLRLSQNQVRLLEAAGHDMDGICQVMDIGRSTLFRIKSGTE